MNAVNYHTGYTSQEVDVKKLEMQFQYAEDFGSPYLVLSPTFEKWWNHNWQQNHLLLDKLLKANPQWSENDCRLVFDSVHQLDPNSRFPHSRIHNQIINELYQLTAQYK